MFFFRFTSVTILLLLILVAHNQSLDSTLLSAECTRYGATLIRSELAPNFSEEPLPVVSFSDHENNWRIVPGDANSGVDAHRFYFTIEASGHNLPAPSVDVIWPGVMVSRVIGASEFKTTEQGIRFIPVSPHAPTNSFTEVVFGSVHLGLFHNWNVRQCGSYRDVEYPDSEIQAHLNYMLGVLEITRLWGWTNTSKPDFVDHINIYGFETHFPNGHRDFPSHFHIMLAWDGWNAANVGHYLLRSDGSIIKNSMWSLHKDIERHDQPGIITQYQDKTDRVIFETVILDDGSGLIVRRPNDHCEYLLRGGSNGSIHSVEVCKRQSQNLDSTDWESICEVQAIDDASRGFFVSNAVYSDGSKRTISLRYDIDTGDRIEISEEVANE